METVASQFRFILLHAGRFLETTLNSAVFLKILDVFFYSLFGAFQPAGAGETVSNARI